MHEMQSIFFLTPVEYAVLLAGKGVKKHYTLQADAEKMGEEEICLAMAHLYQTGFIDSDVKEFFLTEKLENIMNTVAQADMIYCVRFGRHEKRDFCCFVCGDEVVILRISRRDENLYEVYQSSKKEVVDILVQSLQTQQVYEPVLDEANCYEELCAGRESISREVIRKFHNLHLSLEGISPTTGTVKQRFLLRFTTDGITGEEVKGARGSLLTERDAINRMLQDIVENGGD